MIYPHLFQSSRYNRPDSMIVTFDKCVALSGATTSGNVQEAARLSGRNLCAHLRLAYALSCID